jgi:hypothetical protein
MKYHLKLEDASDKIGGTFDNKPLYLASFFKDGSGFWEFHRELALEFPTVQAAFWAAAREHARNKFVKKDKLFLMTSANEVVRQISLVELNAVFVEAKTELNNEARARSAADEQIRENKFHKKIKDLVGTSKSKSKAKGKTVEIPSAEPMEPAVPAITTDLTLAVKADIVSP